MLGNVSNVMCSLLYIFMITLKKKILYIWKSQAQKAKLGFPGGSVVKNLPANTEDAGWISESERSPREGNGNPF